MKFNTISSGNISADGKKPSLTIYTDPDCKNDKVNINIKLQINLLL